MGVQSVVKTFELFITFFYEKKIPNFIEFFKVEKFLKRSLDSIPSSSPSVKIQIMGT